HWLATAPAWGLPLSLHDALPIFSRKGRGEGLREPACRTSRFPPRKTPHPASQPSAAQSPSPARGEGAIVLPSQRRRPLIRQTGQDRKSTRLNSSHVKISYALFCL